MNVFLPVMSSFVGRSTGRFGYLPFKWKRIVYSGVLHHSDRITAWHLNTAFSEQVIVLDYYPVCSSDIYIYCRMTRLLDPGKINITLLSVTVCTVIYSTVDISLNSSSSYCPKSLISDWSNKRTEFSAFTAKHFCTF